ncbi:MCE family protein [[Mycobacterium] wendilense]|uniref:MCE family protein n=2 Tax=[Mycobacterium] wendilense TaxID=3064284 RepID=A0ABM9MBE1_9MYCO|nr:MCE family protein [Mycolicibacterium sp. MU0050]CAJ1581077.1 MCE family protein [Mycolicibacterium sp. MU0050]
MTRTYRRRSTALAVVLVAVLLAAMFVVLRGYGASGRTHFTAYFENSNGVYPGDEVRILGVPVGEIDSIEPEADRAKIVFWVQDKYQVPADARAVILSPQLVTARSIELTPVYTGGPVLQDQAVIPLERTAVPVEWDDLRDQLEKLTDSLQPTEPGGVSTLGAFVNTTADNLRGQGSDIRQTVVKLGAAMSVLGDHSDDLFTSMKNVSLVVSALRDSTDLMRQLNGNLASATGLLANDPNEVGSALQDLAVAVDDVTGFLEENREAIGTGTDKMASVTTALNESIEDVKQFFHVSPNTLQNFYNIYQPAQASLTGALAVNNFADPISFLCGAIQAASRLGAEESAKLCVQYLAPIVKNRQYNFPPFGVNPFVGASARPNEITYSEDWLRPDFRPNPAPAPEPAAADAVSHAAEATSTDPNLGLSGLMVPQEGGS